jgi:hypothetical protein
MSLDDANMVITTTVNAGVTNVTSTMNMRMYDRTVEKIEDVVTPVRLFPDCYKLVYYREMSMSTPSRSGGSPTVSVLSRTKTEQWMAVGIGVVKTKEYNIEIAGGSDTYDLQGWSELTSID